MSSAEQFAELDATRVALRTEIGPPTDRDRNWQPMVSAYEVRLLLDALDRMEALADEWESTAGTLPRFLAADRLRTATHPPVTSPGADS